MNKVFAGTIVVSCLFIASGFSLSKTQTPLTGAWNAKSASTDHVLIFQDGYFSYSIYDKANRKFIRTWGGTYTESGGQMHANIEFDTETKDNVGGHKHFAASISGTTLKLDMGAGATTWTRIDEGNANLAGNWRITGRMRDGSIQPIQKSPRKTLKILSSTRFQWMAINTETKEFSGTIGGTYTFKDSKYT